jgi:hypothetical protein
MLWEVNYEVNLLRAAMGLRILGLDASPCIIMLFYVSLPLCF